MADGFCFITFGLVRLSAFRLSAQGIQSVGDQMSWREDDGMRTCPREAGPPGPRLSSPGERNAVIANRVGVNMLQFCSVSNSLSHTSLSIKWEVYFSKRLCRSSLLCRRYDSICICFCIVGHGYTTNCRHFRLFLFRIRVLQGSKLELCAAKKKKPSAMTQFTPPDI